MCQTCVPNLFNPQAREDSCRIKVRVETENKFKVDRAWIETALRNSDAWRQFVDHYSPDLWKLCKSVCAESECNAAFVECWKALRANNDLLLRKYDGRSSVRTYLLQVGVDLLAGRLRALLSTDPERVWEAFERFFGKEILQMIFRVAGSPQQLGAFGSSVEDVYQDLAIELSTDGFRRLRAYDGRGSLTGFVRRVLRNLCLDWRRKQRGRRRLPVAILNLGEVEQQVYQWMYWSGCSAEEAEGRLLGRKTEREAQELVKRVQETAGPSRPGKRGPERSVSFDAELHLPMTASSSPEEILLDAERDAERERLLDFIQRTVGQLATNEQLYIRLRFHREPPLPPQEIAAFLGVSTVEIYRIRQQVVRRLREELTRDGYDLERIGQLWDE